MLLIVLLRILVCFAPLLRLVLLVFSIVVIALLLVIVLLAVVALTYMCINLYIIIYRLSY